MKQHTQRFKEAITELGKQQSVLITYTIDNEEVILGVEEINSATPRSIFGAVPEKVDSDRS